LTAGTLSIAFSHVSSDANSALNVAATSARLNKVSLSHSTGTDDSIPYMQFPKYVYTCVAVYGKTRHNTTHINGEKRRISDVLKPTERNDLGILSVTV